jgi:hypothetical protein
VTLDNMFKAAEINRQTEEAVEREKEKKSQVEYHMRQEAELPIINRLENELENNFAWLTSKELEVLLQWKGVPVLKMGNIAKRQELYQQFAEGGAEVWRRRASRPHGQRLTRQSWKHSEIHPSN